jgi:hypothetical protein
MQGLCSASGEPNAMQSVSKVMSKDARGVLAALQPVQRAGEAGKGQQGASLQAPGTLKRMRTPEKSRKALNAKKKGRTDGDQDEKKAQAIGQEIKQLMQVIDTMMHVRSCFHQSGRVWE